MKPSTGFSTRARLKAVPADLIEPALSANRGCLLKMMGNGFPAKFTFVVAAVACAIAIQREMPRRADPGTGPFRLRIGNELGDVIVEDDAVHGDGVNVAARLDALAEPDGVAMDRFRDELRAAGLPA